VLQHHPQVPLLKPVSPGSPHQALRAHLLSESMVPSMDSGFPGELGKDPEGGEQLLTFNMQRPECCMVPRTHDDLIRNVHGVNVLR
jgi:hypothetical protein